jgi:hypothetical protein
VPPLHISTMWAGVDARRYMVIFRIGILPEVRSNGSNRIAVYAAQTTV